MFLCIRVYFCRMYVSVCMYMCVVYLCMHPYLYVYVCIYVCMYAYAYLCLCRCSNVYVHFRRPLHEIIGIVINVRLCLYVWGKSVCLYGCMCTYVHVFMCVCICVCMNECVRVCACMFVCELCVFIFCLHQELSKYTHTFTHIRTRIIVRVRVCVCVCGGCFYLLTLPAFSTRCNRRASIFERLSCLNRKLNLRHNVLWQEKYVIFISLIF